MRYWEPFLGLYIFEALEWQWQSITLSDLAEGDEYYGMIKVHYAFLAFGSLDYVHRRRKINAFCSLFHTCTLHARTSVGVIDVTPISK